MNSVRIGIIGILVDRYGIGQAEGFLHFFEGWVIFLACIAHPVRHGDGDAAALRRPPAARRGDRPRLHRPRRAARPRPHHPGLARAGRRRAPHRGALGRLGAGAARARPSRRRATPSASSRVELGGWSGDARALDPKIEATLGADDYLSALYRSPAEAEPVDFFALLLPQPDRGRARSTRPRSACRPPAGRSSASSPVEIALPGTRFGTVALNRAMIQKGLEKQLVYYWFEGRGRRMTNDFAAKFYTVADSMTRGRTDGGLVRVITPIGAGGEAAGRRPAAALPPGRRRPAAPLHPGIAARAHARPPPPPRRAAARLDPGDQLQHQGDDARLPRQHRRRDHGAPRGDRARQRLARRLGRGDRRRPSRRCG